jgi:hypothetical protein
MATYRERREARAEQLREWADRREAKQPALNQAARADEATTGIPFGQPILAITRRAGTAPRSPAWTAR